MKEYLSLIPAVKHTPQRYLWSSYDSDADVLYINFKKPSHATDSELTDDDIIIRYTTLMGTLKNPMLNTFHGDAHKSRFSNALIIMELRTRT